MARHHAKTITFLLTGLLVCATGCASDQTDGKFPRAEVILPMDLAFTEVVVEGQAHDGWFGAKSARFDVTGTVTNNTDAEIGSDGLPCIVDERGEVKVSGRLEEDKLEPGETGTFRYEGEIPVGDNEAPTLTFSGDHTFSGLDEAQHELDETIAEVFDEYANQEEQKKAEEEREEKRKQKEIDDLESCKGKTAIEALKVAEGTDYEAVFKDDHEVDVTDDVKTAKSESKVAKAVVTNAEISQGGLFSRPAATFTLDYTDPEAAEKRADKEAVEKAKNDVRNAKGKTVDEALEAAEKAGFTAHLKDVEGNEVSLDDLKKAPADHLLRKARITDSSTFLSSVTYTADYKLSDEQMHATYSSVKIGSNVTGSYDQGYYNITVKVEGNVENDTLVPIFAPDLPVFVQNNKDVDFWCWLHYPGEEDITDYLYPYTTSEFSYAISFECYWNLTADQVDEYTVHLLTFEEQDGAAVDGLEGVEDSVNSEIRGILKGIAAGNAARKEQRDRDLAEQRMMAEQRKMEATCYVTETGYAYHSSSQCHTIRNSTLYELTVGEAIEEGYEPCAFCS